MHIAASGSERYLQIKVVSRFRYEYLRIRCHILTRTRTRGEVLEVNVTRSRADVAHSTFFTGDENSIISAAIITRAAGTELKFRLRSFFF